MNTQENHTSTPSLYPAEFSRHETVQTRPNDDTSHDERLAQQLQAYYDQENHAPVIAQPLRAAEMPYNCGHCGQTHLVRNVVHNSAFACTRCGRQNRIMLENLRQPVVVVESGTWVPVPIICNLM
ncbi:hypothetical protein Poli38472_009149 [Pythium oligandrum]|uniref:Uncharacterized protein n=1 Tax=Pythium oligandrum TaxID=41045 RepID=A0A8K1FML2_PYTOL|nr:hypothetical protein Poli38472_009149 [Pythium oligandrum]|eukprot:TMW64982.1 hypothetical protein Poli38472_009149 [Pythium oligandrum]